MFSLNERRPRFLLRIVLIVLLIPVAAFGYDQWRSGLVCQREFDSASERYEVCLATEADRTQVCFNLENVPWLCSERFLAGHPELLALRATGVAREQARCATEHGGPCSADDWAEWCRANYLPADQPAGEDRKRTMRCTALGPA